MAACGQFPYDCIADFAINVALILLVVALSAYLLGALFDVFRNGRLGGAVKATISIAGASLVGGAATAIMMCASREMTNYLIEVIDEQLAMAEEYNAVFQQMFAANPSFYAWGRHTESYAESCELGSVARARTPALRKISEDAYTANKSRGRFQVGHARRIFRDSALAIADTSAILMATMANIEERMKLTAELGNWARRTSILRTLGHMPDLSSGYRLAMNSYDGLASGTSSLTGYLAGQTGAAVRLAMEVGVNDNLISPTSDGNPTPEYLRLPVDDNLTANSDVPPLIRTPGSSYTRLISEQLEAAQTPDYRPLSAPDIS